MRLIFLGGAAIAAIVAVRDLVANFVPSDLIGIALLLGAGVWTLRRIRHSKEKLRQPNNAWLAILVVILTWFTLGYVQSAITGTGDVNHDHWFVMGFALSALWTLLGQFWFPPQKPARQIDPPFTPSA